MKDLCKAYFIILTHNIEDIEIISFYNSYMYQIINTDPDMENTYVLLHKLPSKVHKF